MAYTNIDDPSAYFQTALYTGNANYNTITNNGNSNLGPDLIWGKCRSTSKLNFLYDTTRGVEKRIESDNTGAEDINTNGVLNFYTTGFRLGSGNTENDSGESYVAWQWKANGGTTSSNTAGNITSTVQANTTAGFSIITWTGTGSAGTIGHGLGVAPAMLIVKNRTTALDWAVYHKNMIDAGYTLAINNTDGQIDSGTNRWNHTAPTSSVIHIGAGQQTNQSSNNMVCYAFAEKQGYSKFGWYVGNGSADGTFVYTGFKPAFIMAKVTGTGSWLIYDHKRIGHNPDNYEIYANLSNAEEDNDRMDILSNGFKMRLNNTDSNQIASYYIYMAFAENPFVTSTGVPACAR